MATINYITDYKMFDGSTSLSPEVVLNVVNEKCDEETIREIFAPTVRSVDDNWSVKTRIICNQDGLHDLLEDIHAEIETHPQWEIFLELRQSIYVGLVGEFHEGTLYSVTLPPQQWTSTGYQAWLERFVMFEWDGCFHMEVDYANDSKRILGYLADYPDFYLPEVYMVEPEIGVLFPLKAA